MVRYTYKQKGIIIMRLTTSKEETFANELKSFIEIASRNTHVFLTKQSDNEIILGLLGNKRTAKVTVVDGKYTGIVGGDYLKGGSLSDSKLLELEDSLTNYMKYGDGGL